MLIDTAEPGAPEVCMEVIPDIRPCKDWSTLVMGADLSVFSSSEAEAPAKSLFFIMP